MAKRKYTDDERAEALAATDANGGNIERTAQQLSIPRKTLEGWSRGRVGDGVEEKRAEIKQGLAERLEGLADKLVGALLDKAATAPLAQTAVAFGIIVDKMNLLRGKPTSITGHMLTDAERAARIAELMELARQRRSAVLVGQGKDRGPEVVQGFCTVDSGSPVEVLDEAAARPFGGTSMG